MQPPLKIRHFRKALGLTLEELAADVGLSISQISRAERGQKDLKVDELRRIAARLKTSIAELPNVSHHNVAHQEDPKINEVPSTVSLAVSIRPLPVVGEAAAGLWMEQDVWDEYRYEPVPHVPGRYENLEQAAYHVSGNSMDLEGITDGSFVVTVPYYETRTALTDGDICIVERRKAGLVERTCKKIAILADGYELRPCSSDPKWKPIVFASGQWDDDGTEVEVIGRVIYVGRPVA